YQCTFWRRRSGNGTCDRFPTRFAHYVQQMRVFAGKYVRRCSNAATVSCIIYRGEFSPLLSSSRRTEFDRCLQRVLAMRSVKAVTTLASVAAIVCSIFAFSWVGLALLGFLVG